MLYWLTEFSDGGDFFNLFRYITFRAGMAFATALIFGFLFGRPLIDLLRRKQGKGQPIRDDGPQSHLAKVGTPTMGGLLILSALVFSTLLWARLDNPYVWITLLVTLAFGLIGFADDYAKVTKQNTKGVSGRARMLAGLDCRLGKLCRCKLSSDRADQPTGVALFQGCAVEPVRILHPLWHVRDRGRGQCGEPDRRA